MDIAAAIENAPWKNNDRVVLRNKWRAADETACQLERYLVAIELIKIKFDIIKKNTPAHDALFVEASKLLCDSAAILIGQVSTNADSRWFLENVQDWQREQLLEIRDDIVKAKYNEIFILQIERFVFTLVTVGREFADAMELSLNTWTDLITSNKFRFLKEVNGVRINGKLVEVVGKAADVLHFLCNHIETPSEYEDFADLFDSDDAWKQSLGGGDNEAIESTKKNIRTCLSTIRKAIRLSFSLSKDKHPDPVAKNKTGDGWKLDKALLSQ